MEQALRFLWVRGFEAGLRAGDFILEVKHSPRTADQTELLFHRITHDFECETVGTCRVSEQWKRSDRAVTKFCQSVQTGEELGEDFEPRFSKPIVNKHFRLEARVGIVLLSPQLHVQYA